MHCSIEMPTNWILYIIFVSITSAIETLCLLLKLRYISSMSVIKIEIYMFNDIKAHFNRLPSIMTKKTIMWRHLCVPSWVINAIMFFCYEEIYIITYLKVYVSVITVNINNSYMKTSCMFSPAMARSCKYF